MADYTFRYADGTTGSSPYQLDANGNFIYGEGGRLSEGSQIGGITGQQAMSVMGYDVPMAEADSGYSNPTPGGATTNYMKPEQIGGPGASGNAGYTQGQNPYLYQMGDALVQQNTQNFNRNVMPRIGSAAMATNGYGGSRQGVVEANAINDLNTTNANALANLYGNGFNTALQYDLGRRNNDLGYFGAANSYNLGMGNLGLGYAGLDRQIANDNMSWGQQGYNNNMGLWGQLMNNNQTGIGAGANIQNTPQGYWQQFGNQYNSIGQGYGTQTSSGGGGNPIMGALGGAQLGSQVANWWNGGGSGTGMTGSNAPASSYNIGSFDYGIGGGGGGGLGLKF